MSESWDQVAPHFNVPHIMRDNQERENVVAAYYAGLAEATQNQTQRLEAAAKALYETAGSVWLERNPWGTSDEAEAVRWRLECVDRAHIALAAADAGQPAPERQEPQPEG